MQSGVWMHALRAAHKHDAAGRCVGCAGVAKKCVGYRGDGQQ